jgi:aquaporin Z
VLVAAGGGMMGQAFPDTISRTAAVAAPGMMVMAIILFMVYIVGPLVGAVVAVGTAFILRGRGGGRAGSGAAQGALQEEIANPDKV